MLYCRASRKAKVLWQGLGRSAVQSPLIHFSPSLFGRWPMAKGNQMGSEFRFEGDLESDRMSFTSINL